MEDMKQYATVTINVDSQGMARLLIKKNISMAMKLLEVSKRKEKLMAIYDDKKQTLTVLTSEQFEKRMKAF